MYFGLNDEQKMLAQTARRFVEKECPSSKVRQIMQTENAYDAELWQKMATNGWLGLTVPEEYGGLGESWLTVLALFEELGRGVVPGPLLATVGLAVPTLVAAGNAPTRKLAGCLLLPRVGVGLLLPISNLLTATRWILLLPRPALLADNNYSLSGSKMFVLDAKGADIIVVSAKDSRNATLGLFLVEKDAAG